MEVLICVVGFMYTEVSSVLSGPGVANVSKNGIDPLVLETSVNYMCRSMELVCCKNCW